MVHLELAANGGRRETIFLADADSSGFRVSGERDYLTAGEVVNRLRTVCLDAVSLDGSLVPGVLDMHDALPTRFPIALHGGTRWHFIVNGRGRPLSLIREVNSRALELVLETERIQHLVLNGSLVIPPGVPLGAFLTDVFGS